MIARGLLEAMQNAEHLLPQRGRKNLWARWAERLEDIQTEIAIEFPMEEEEN